MQINGTEMVIFGKDSAAVEAAANLSKTKQLASGAVTMSYLTMKEYGQRFGLKGQALKRAHERYRVERGTAANANLASLIAKGQVVLERVSVAKDRTSFTGKFTAASMFNITDPTAEAKKLSDAELLAIIEARKSAGEQEGENKQESQT